MQYLLVHTTTPDRETAQKIADAVVTQRLAASAHIGGPTHGTYWWEEKIHRHREWWCEIRTGEDRLAEIQELIMKLHPYDVPEILAWPLVMTQEDNLAWLKRYTQPKPDAGNKV